MDQYIIGRLPNGLEYIYVDIPNLYSFSLCISIRVGSNDEDSKINGVSHLLEHLIFKSNNRFKSKYDLYRSLDSLGATYNAYTDKNITTFFVKANYLYAKDLIDIFSSLICEPDIKASDLENEKKIIIEEIRNTRDEPFDALYNRFFRLNYPDDPISRKISGSPKNIEEMTLDEVQKHVRQFYTSNNMVVSMVGKIEQSLIDYLEKTSLMKAPKTQNKWKPRKLLSPKMSTSIDFVHKPIQQMYLGISFPMDGLYSKDIYTMKLIELILMGSMSSRLFTRLREKEGLVYSVSASMSAYEEAGLFFIITSFEKDKYSNVLKSLFQEFKRLQVEKVPDNELNRWKNYMRSNISIQVENTMDMADYYARQMLFFRENIQNFKQILDKYMEITPENVLDVAQNLFDWKKMKLVIIGDYSVNGQNTIKNVVQLIKSSYQ